MSQGNDPIEDRLDKISEAIVFLTEKISILEQRVGRMEGFKKSANISMPIDAPLRPEPAMRKTPEFVPDRIIGSKDIFARESDLKAYPEKKENKEESFEAEIGRKWLGRIGILALIFGVAFFLKFAFDNNWIDETGRVALGILTGLGLIVLGDYLREKYTSYAGTLTGGGIAVLYLSIYASFDYYHLLEQTFAFAAMSVITAIGSYLAIRYERINLAALSIAGGFLTPLLLSTGNNNQIGLFSYMTILNLGVLAISFFRNWQKLNLFGFFATLFLYSGWSARYYSPDELVVTIVFLTLWFIIYSVAVVSHNILSKKITDGADLLLIILNALVYFGISYFLLVGKYGDYMGFFAVLMAAVYFVFAYLSFELNREDKELAMFFPMLSIFFLTIAAPIQFDGVWVTAAWAAEAVILAMAGFSLNNYMLRVYAWVILALAAIRLIFVDSMEISAYGNFNLFFNERFLVFAAGIISTAIIYYLYSKYEMSAEKEELKGKAVALVLLNFLLLWNLSAEVLAYYSAENNYNYKISRNIYPDCERYSYNSRGGYVAKTYCEQQWEEYNNAQTVQMKEIKSIQNKKNVALTLLWALYAIMLLAVGFRGKNKLLRIMGIGLFGIVIVKLFLYDLWNLGGVYPIISFVAMGAILLAASFAYNKYRERIKEII